VLSASFEVWTAVARCLFALQDVVGFPFGVVSSHSILACSLGSVKSVLRTVEDAHRVQDLRRIACARHGESVS